MIDTISTLGGIGFLGALIVIAAETIAPELCERVYAAIGAVGRAVVVLATALYREVMECAQRAVVWADEHYPDSERRWPR